MATKAVNLAKGHHYHCDYCSQDISHTIRIRCAECNDFDLCVECFSVGVELEQHTNDHDYFVMDRLNFPVINLDWLATEELLLLEGIELHGMGNWDDIAEHVSTKTAEQCSQHYFQQYIEGPSAPLPELAPRFSPEEIAEAQERAAHTVVTKPVRKGKTAGSQPIDQDLGGYMPRRGEFEFEYDNDAEFLLMDMEFHDVDTPLERELKLATLHMYNERLLEREAKRDFVVRHQLMDLKRTAREEQQRSKENKALYARTKKALQLLDKSEALEDFVQDLSAEQELQKRIDKLIEYRLKGIRTMLDANHYEGQIRRRETQMRKQRRESSNIYGYPERSKERGSRWINRDRGDATAQPTPSSSTDSLATSTPFDLASAPGYDLLSMKERQLCETLYLYPSQYTLVKEAIIRECAKTGSLQKSTARFLAKTDVYKTSAIFDFLQASGWINTTSASSDA